MVEPLKIGTRKQLFVDDIVVDRTAGVARTLNQPTKYVGNPIMIPLYPWEGSLELYGAVWHDDGGFRMWYTDLSGMVAVAVLDGSGTQYPGFSTQECALFDGDSTRHRVTWCKNLSLEELKDRDVRLKFDLRNAKLYAFAVGDWSETEAPGSRAGDA